MGQNMKWWASEQPLREWLATRSGGEQGRQAGFPLQAEGSRAAKIRKIRPGSQMKPWRESKHTVPLGICMGGGGRKDTMLRRPLDHRQCTAVTPKDTQTCAGRITGLALCTKHSVSPGLCTTSQMRIQLITAT